MSRFDELHKAYVAARQVFFARRDASVAFAASMFEGLERHLECPRLALHFLSHARATSLVKTRTAEEALWLGTDDLWHFGIGLDLSDAGAGARKEAAKQTVVCEVLLQPTATGFTVGLKGWSDRFDLPADAGSAERTAFYEFVFQRMLGSYHEAGQRFFASLADSTRALGA